MGLVAGRIHIQQARDIGPVGQRPVVRNLDGPVARIISDGGVGEAIQAQDHDRARFVHIAGDQWHRIAGDTVRQKRPGIVRQRDIQALEGHRFADTVVRRKACRS